MILIWGWKSRLKTLSQGTFHCPHCQADRQYDQRQARRWFTIFWIPLIPLKVLGTFVECTTSSACPGSSTRRRARPTNRR